MNIDIVKTNVNSVSLNSWSDIDWKSVNSTVIKLRRRIFNAKRNKDCKSLISLQKLMLSSSANILYSIRKISYNPGSSTPGIDGITLKSPADRINLFNEISRIGWSNFSPKPIRRIYIKEPNKLRPIGIPTILDRVIQVMLVNSLEPEWEAVFEKGSYGFRPKRGVNDAVLRIWLALNKPTSRQWIVDSDISKCFDSISHDYLLCQLRGFPGSNLIKEMLLSGVIIKDVWFSSEDEGTPQGSAISPLLCNIALHGLESELGVIYTKKGYVSKSGRLLIRYADDLVIICNSRDDAVSALDSLESSLLKRGLSISTSKTKIVHISEGFDFLGFNFKLGPKRHISMKNSIICFDNYKYKIVYENVGVYVSPSKKSIKKVKHNLKDAYLKSKGLSAEKFIDKLNPIVRGYAMSKLHWHSHDAFKELDYYLYILSWRWAIRKHPQKGSNWIKEKYFKHLKLGFINSKWVFSTTRAIKKDSEDSFLFLYKFRWFPINRFYPAKMDKLPDNKVDTDYFKSLDLQRLIRRPFNLFRRLDFDIAVSQDGLCPICSDNLFNGENLHLHHIIPRKDGGKMTFSNLLYLHIGCHFKTHYSGKYSEYIPILNEYKIKHPKLSKEHVKRLYVNDDI